MVRCKLCDSVVNPSAHEEFDTCNCEEVFVDTSGAYARAGARTSITNIIYIIGGFSPRAEAEYT